MITRPFFPIIYVRGYAMRQKDIEEAVASPHMGFNVGATFLRQSATAKTDRLVFESPLIRLIKEYGYTDYYANGIEIPATSGTPAKTVVTYRYYDDASGIIGPGVSRTMETHAENLGRLIFRLRDQVLLHEGERSREGFRVYLVAHSMGGLICRTLLQNSYLAPNVREAADLVDKVFTYGTPHNGIDMKLIGNTGEFFKRKTMAWYLGLTRDTQEQENWDGNVNALNGMFPAERFFCLVGTNHTDYSVARGLARRLVGAPSDGLVRVENARLLGSPSAYIHASHSGPYGMVNSEAGYLNLRRFLFGDFRLNLRFTLEDLQPPESGDEGIDSVAAEFRVHVQGEGVPAHANVRDDLVAALVPIRFELGPNDTTRYQSASVEICDLFLLSTQATDAESRILFNVEVAIGNPWHLVNGRPTVRFIEGSYLHRDVVTCELQVPEIGLAGAHLNFSHGGTDRTYANAERRETSTDHARFLIPLASSGPRPRLRGQLRVDVLPWNQRDDVKGSPLPPTAPKDGDSQWKSGSDAGGKRDIPIHEEPFEFIKEVRAADEQGGKPAEGQRPPENRGLPA